MSAVPYGYDRNKRMKGDKSFSEKERDRIGTVPLGNKYISLQTYQ
jgi:hypothetical protein